MKKKVLPRKNSGKVTPVKTRSSGGLTTAGEMGYQYSYAAWLASRFLLDEPVAQNWLLAADVKLTSILMEQDSAVDDIIASTSNLGFIFVQAKRSLRVSSHETSPFVKTLKSVVDLICRFPEHLSQDGHVPRNFDSSRNCIVVAMNDSNQGCAYG